MQLLPAIASGIPQLNTIYNMDALAMLKAMPDECVNCVVTSPPYWGLRDYGTATWIGGDTNCSHQTGRGYEDNLRPSVQGLSRPGLNHSFCKLCGAKRVDKQIGLESTLKEFIDTLVGLFREVRRVLKTDGTCWINMGDSYASSVNGRSAADTKATGNDDRTFRDKPFSTVGNGLKPKDLCGQPWRLALALQDDGWWLRQDIIWAKPNPMPESVEDRCTKSHEYIFLMTKCEHYWFDAEAIREPASDWGTRDRTNGKYHNEGTGLRPHTGLKGNRKTFRGGGTYTHSGAFNNSDYKPNTTKGNSPEPVIDRNKRSVWTVPTAQSKESHFATFPIELIKPIILAGCPQDGIVYDPFMGSGTTALVARMLGRSYLGSELNADYIKIASDRLRMPFTSKQVKVKEPTMSDLPLFATTKATEVA